MENNEIMEDISENENLTTNEDIKNENDDSNVAEITNNTEGVEVNDANQEDFVLKEDEAYLEKNKKRKVALIVVLSILLFLDILALVIYLIGIDKVLGFIK